MTCRFFGFALAVIGLTLAKSATACAVCATADVALPPVEGEAAFRGRLQATLDVREGWVEAGGVTVSDHRADLGLYYAPVSDWLFSIGVPVLLRDISGEGTPLSARVVPGDVGLRAERTHTSRLRSGAKQRFGVFVQLRLPTAPLENDGAGRPLSSVLEPGCGSILPVVGADYWVGRRTLSFWSSFSVWLPFAVRDGYHAGDSLRFAARFGWQPLRTLGVRFGGNLNADAEGELVRPQSDPNSGGLIGYVAGEIVTTPYPDVSVTVGALYPALTVLSGDHHEGPIATATLGYDF